MKGIGGLVVAWCCLTSVAACDIVSSIGKDEASKDEAPAGKKPTGSIDCEAFCNKQSLCFPGAPDDANRWTKHCVQDCRTDEAKGGFVAEFTRAAAGCSGAACGDAYGTCIEKTLTKSVAKADLDKHSYLGLPQPCIQSHACFLAQHCNAVDPEIRGQVRSRMLTQRNELYNNLHDSNVEAAKIACRMEVESKNCAGAEGPKKAGAAIALSCDDYCDKQKACYPKSASADKWESNCREACRAEAKAGTTEAAFFAAVAACKQAACGEALGKCLAEKVETLWPKSASSGWDMRGLAPACMLFRACTEATFHASDTDTVRLTREATYGSYQKVFTQLKRDGGDSATQCTTMASYVECK